MKLKSGRTSCPKCGNDNQFYTLSRASGYISTQFCFDGDREPYNDHMYDSLKDKPLKTAYCSSCHKNLGSVIREDIYTGRVL
ncbi:hypothetical protein [Morganella psychrotolerans]|uniref:Uncharacterized protein n=1 Tax=Morganella psychrotolerans TaxID=368603 RepID=A0A1B8HL55_9GAMM|nr:hypothetical protein [Morganella psychrotolerans]OBU10179.1 hypothetical protein AYY18_18880 [Morganella psychrotolerans]